MASIYEKNQLEIGEFYIYAPPWRYMIFKPLELIDRTSRIEGENIHAKLKYLEDYKIDVLVDLVNKKHVRGQHLKPSTGISKLRDTDTILDSVKIEDNWALVFIPIFDKHRNWK